jgi:hypothetical protein
VLVSGPTGSSAAGMRLSMLIAAGLLAASTAALFALAPARAAVT